MNLLPVTAATGGNSLVLGSHRLFPQHYLGDPGNESRGEDYSEGDVNDDGSAPSLSSCAAFYQQRLDEVDGDDWLEVDPNDAVLLDPKRVVTILLGPGDLLLWDSRTVHSSYPGSSDEEIIKYGDGAPALDTAAHGLIRAAALVTMVPMERVSEGILRQRKEAVCCSRTLTHWADKIAPLGEERGEEAAKERECIEFMRKAGGDGVNGIGRKVVLGYDDLSPKQRAMVCGHLFS